VRSILLVRHGKASAFLSTGDYDLLSPLGVEQSERVGVALAEHGVAPRAVFIGPRQRHLQSYEAAARAYAGRGAPLPQPVALRELDEHDGVALVTKLLPVIAAEDPGLRDLVVAAARGETPSQDDMIAAFKRVALRWIRGELHHVDVESWPDFRARVRAGLAQLAAAPGEGPVLAFTSAGVIASAVGQTLGLSDERVLDLSLVPNNASLSEVDEGAEGLRLLRFNGVGHLPEGRLLTLV
jgi:broad specificity phosphatase PhoE